MSLHDASWGVQEPLVLWVKTHPQMFSSALANVLLMFAPLVFVSPVRRYIILLILNGLLSTLMLVDAVHLRWYGDLVSIASFPLIPMLGRVGNSVFRELRWLDALYYVDVVLAIILLPVYKSRWKSAQPSGKHKGRIFSFALICGLLLFVPSAVIMWEDENGLFAYISDRRDVCAVIGLPLYHILDAQLHTSWRTQRVDEAQREQVSRYLQSQQSEAVSKLFGMARGRNVILISAESLLSFPLGLQINGAAVTPRLSAFQAESLYFENYYDQTHLGTTSDAEFMALNSLYPSANGAVTGEYRKNHFLSLPGILVSQGYSTLSAVGAEPGLWRMKEMHAAYGFQKSLYKSDYQITEVTNGWLSDKQFFSQTLPMLPTLRKPFFAFLLSSTNHHPFELPPKSQGLPLGELQGTILGNYLNTVHYFDQAFGEFIDGLKTAGLLDQSIIVVYGDHRAFLGLRPDAAQRLARFLTVPEWDTYYRLTIGKKVPLFIRLPHAEYASLRSNPGGHMDIAPTLLSLLGIKRANSVMLGRDLTKENDALVAFRDGSFINTHSLLINRFGPISNCTCYDLKSGQDISCGVFDAQRDEIRKRLEVSDLILQGDLIPYLQAHQEGASAAAVAAPTGE